MPVDNEQSVDSMSGDGEQFVGGLETLGTIETARDAHEAEGIWWANALLASRRHDNGDPRTEHLADAIQPIDTESIEAHIGGFAKAVEHLSREQDAKRADPSSNEPYDGGFSVDYAPDLDLRKAAELAGITEDVVRIFPWKTYSKRDDDGKLFVREGYTGERTQVWPAKAA